MERLGIGMTLCRVKPTLAVETRRLHHQSSHCAEAGMEITSAAIIMNWLGRVVIDFSRFTVEA